MISMTMFPLIDEQQNGKKQRKKQDQYIPTITLSPMVDS